jgi:hypothetical protein
MSYHSNKKEEYFHKAIKNFEISYLFAKELKHGITDPNYKENWQLFEPSKFIYSFFAFDMICSIDWAKSIMKKRLVYLNGGIFKNKLNNLLDFLHANNCIDFRECYSQFDPRFKLSENSKKIQLDFNIRKYDNSKYGQGNTIMSNYITSADNLAEGNFEIDSHYKLLFFTYQIRNNIFHGTKTISHMLLDEQRERLIDYTNILLSTLEQLFNILEKEIDYYRSDSSDIVDNLPSTYRSFMR